MTAWTAATIARQAPARLALTGHLGNAALRK